MFAVRVRGELAAPTAGTGPGGPHRRRDVPADSEPHPGTGDPYRHVSEALRGPHRGEERGPGEHVQDYVPSSPLTGRRELARRHHVIEARPEAPLARSHP